MEDSKYIRFGLWFEETITNFERNAKSRGLVNEVAENAIINERITNNGIENFTSETGVAPGRN